jgi:cellulose synthase/poly-beta-1,6-N-acetylglucosamine synthase-like glycosyltransferase
MFMYSIDIIIPAKNEAKSIAQCLKYLQEQDYASDRVHIYVVNHSSTDHTAAIAEAFGVHVIHCPASASIGALRNAGIMAGSGDLLAFIDAHCMAATGWLETMACCFDDETVGGVQGNMQFTYRSPRLQAFVNHSQNGFLKQTLSGKDNIYPWIPSGNAMFRRQAVLAAGLWDEQLHRCEDLDLSWRVLLNGYQLIPSPDARVTHYDDRSWFSYLKNYWHYGYGAAQIAQLYRVPHRSLLSGMRSVREAFLPEWLMAKAFYSAGYFSGARSASQLSPIRSLSPSGQQQKLRSPFLWSSNQWLAIHSETLFWQPYPEYSMVCRKDSPQILELSGSAQDFWRGLTQRQSKITLLAILLEKYKIPSSVLENDLDDFISELIEAQVILYIEDTELQRTAL